MASFIKVPNLSGLEYDYSVENVKTTRDSNGKAIASETVREYFKEDQIVGYTKTKDGAPLEFYKKFEYPRYYIKSDTYTDYAGFEKTLLVMYNHPKGRGAQIMDIKEIQKDSPIDDIAYEMINRHELIAQDVVNLIGLETY